MAEASKVKVLVVEDEWLVRALGAEALIDAGYEVHEANDADEAISVIQSLGEIHVLFTDIRMPGSMSGLELAALVHKRWPAVKLLITSGDTFPDKAAMPDHGKFLPKPYGFGQLQQEVEKLWRRA